jgi:hypothetical protein
MKTKVRENKRFNAFKTVGTGKPNYYFHPDEDFREDWDWGKRKEIASKAITKPKNQFEL